MKTVCFLLVFTVAASAQNIVLSDGKVIASKGLRRQGDTIMATVELAAAEPGKTAPTGEIGYPISKIAKIDFPEPAILRKAPDLISQGKGEEALTQLEPVLKFYEGFREAPGSWWASALLQKAQALSSLGRDDEAAPLSDQVMRLSPDPELKRTAEMQMAARLARRGEFAKAQPIADRALKESKTPETLALASLVRGECLLAAKAWEDAMLSFLQVPVLYPSEKELLPQVLLGQGRALFGMENFADAKAALAELQKTYGTAPEAKLAAVEEQKILRREKALAPSK